MPIGTENTPKHPSSKARIFLMRIPVVRHLLYPAVSSDTCPLRFHATLPVCPLHVSYM
jgi:hypothetical protein